MTAHSPMSTTDKVQALLFEYNSLRTEIMQRNSVFTQYCVISVPATLAATTLVYTAFPPAGVILFLIICSLLYFVFRLIEFDTLAAATRVRELEAMINEMARETLLNWETSHGLYEVGYSHRLAYVLEPVFGLVRSLLNKFGVTAPMIPSTDRADPVVPGDSS
jgi:hypothetical protein